MGSRFFLLWLTAGLLWLTAATALAQSGPTFYFAVSAMASPAQTLVHFTEFQDYLAEKLGTSVSLKQRRTYEEINDLLAREKVQMAFTCTGGYLSGRKAFGLELLAVPVMNGKTCYRSYIVTRLDSPARSLTDLQNLVFAFTDPLSLTGYIYPTARINQMGRTTRDFFKKTFFTESHDKSIEAVATGVADGAAVDSLIFDALRKQGDVFTGRLKIIEISGEFGMPPVVVPPKVSAELKRKLLKVLLSMDKDPAGKNVLNSLGMDGFALPEPELYRSAILLRKEINE
jgi:phosphonate transport system substrate-binding protein